MVRSRALWHSCLHKICAVGITTSTLWPAACWANAQVVSAQDSIQTQVVQQENQFKVFGGTAVDNAKILFHSFEQFDLERGYRAEFYVAPSVETIFSRITSGAPSHINGMIGVSGSPANLYLMNPAGVLFGSEAHLNLAGDFTVLTADRLDFSSGHFGLTNYPENVQGNVLQLHFDANTPGTIINFGNLSINAQQSLSLIGHSVINQGTLNGGTINIAAVGNHESITVRNGFQFASTQAVQTLPPWLTPAGTEHAAVIEINQDGTLSLTGSQLSEILPGTAIVGGELMTTDAPNRIQILGDHVATVGATLRAADGGQILIGGDYQGSSSLSTAQSTFIDAGSTIIADAVNGIGGQVVVWSDGSTQFRGLISAQGTLAGGTVEVSGKEQLYFGGRVDLRSPGLPGTLLLDPENIEIRAGSASNMADVENSQVLYEDTLESAIIGNTNLVLQADNDITIAPLSDGVLTFNQGTSSISFLADADGDGQGSFTMASGDRLSAPGQDIEITAADITTGDFNTNVFSTIDNSRRAGDIHLTATQGSISSGNFTSTARSTLNNNGNGGNIVLLAADAITVGDITTATNSVLNNSGHAGGITLNAQTGAIATGTLNASSSGNNNIGIGGDISLSAMDAIVTGDINTSVQATTNNSGDAGAVSLTAEQGAILSQQITSTTISPDSAETRGGDVRLDAEGEIVVDFINATGQGRGGNIDVATQQSFRVVNTTTTSESTASLLTTGDGRIRLTFNTESNLPFTVGNSDLHGTAGDITTGVDILETPQTVDQPLRLSTIEINNLFESTPDLPPVGPPDEPVPSPLPENLNRPDIENLDVLIHGKNGINHDTQRERERAISDSELIWSQIEEAFSTEFVKALELPPPVPPSLQTTQQTLQQVSNTQGITPALMYVRLKDTHVELVLVSAEGTPIYHPVAVTAADVKAVVETFHQTITNPILSASQYLPVAQQLFNWLIRPILDELEMANIDHIGFILDAGLRSLPMAALHDGQHFLIENYSIGLLPSVGLTSIAASPASEHGPTLAMGIANFAEQADLAAVPLELTLASQSQNDERYLDHESTLAILKQRLEQGNFTNVHLATHAVFQPGSLETSYVQLWDRVVNLNLLKELPLDPIDFLILSACATALGDPTAEFGFAGLAVNVGVQTVLASLWSISDEGTLGLMSEFYRTLESPLTRSEALRQAQLAMLQGKVGIVDGTVYGDGEHTVGHLPNLDASGSWDFSHPAYWSGFTMIGNPWQ
ncbi:MAG: CHAT domain-containing protein [Cyanobacteria bacterium P01_F01_bin.13]